MSTNKIKNFLKQHKQSISCFLLVGASTYVFYIFLFHLCWKTFHLDYKIAVSIAYVVSTATYFFLNRHFTFKSKGHKLHSQAAKFLCQVALSYGITIVIVHATVENLLLSPYFGILFATGTTFILNYFIGRFWVFQKAQPTHLGE